MRRLLLLLGIAVLAIAAVLAVGFALLPREALKTRIAEQISAWTGRDVSLRGEPELRFFPRLAVTLRDLEIGGPPGMGDADLLATDELTGTIRLLPLLIGRVEVETFRMLRPRIHLVRGSGEQKNWTLDSGAAALQLAFAGDVPLGEFVLEDGSLLYDDRSTGRQEHFTDISIAIDWSSIRQPFALTGSATWRGQPVRLSARADNPFAFLKRDPTPVEIDLDSPLLQLAFAGEASREDQVRVTGRLDTAAPSLQAFAGWTGYLLAGTLAGPASLSGDAALEGGELTVEDAAVDLQGQRATGSLSLALGSVPVLRGTLAFDAVDLTPYLGPGEPAGADGDWRRLPLATDWFRLFGADLRLSAATVTTGALQFGATAATASLREGVLEIGIGEARLGSGTIAGDVTITDHSDAPGSMAQTQIRASDIALADLGPPLGLGADFAGTATVATDLQSNGGTLGDHVRTLTGTSSLRVVDGVLPDGGLTQLASAGSAAAPAPVEVEGSPARIAELAAELRFGEGVMAVDSARATTPFWTADLRGTVGLADGALALAGELTPPPGAPPAPPVPVTVEGHLAHPAARRVAGAP